MSIIKKGVTGKGLSKL